MEAFDFRLSCHWAVVMTFSLAAKTRGMVVEDMVKGECIECILGWFNLEAWPG